MKLSERLNRTGKEAGGTAEKPVPTSRRRSQPRSPRKLLRRRRDGRPQPPSAARRAAVAGVASKAAKTPVGSSEAAPAEDSAAPIERRKTTRLPAPELSGLEALRAKVRAGVVADLGPRLTSSAVEDDMVRRPIRRP